LTTPPFGKRGAPPPSAAAGGREAAPSPSLAKSRGDVALDRDERFVPTRIVPVLVAGVVVFFVDLGLSQTILAIERAAGFQAWLLSARYSGIAWDRSGIVPMALVWSVLQFVRLAALICLPAHFVLRWLKFTGLGAYAVGGLCVSFVWLALAATQGALVDIAAIVILLSDGAVVGLLYRLLSGAVPSAGRRETRRSDAIAPPPDRSAD
jgi:hypothetical protein